MPIEKIKKLVRKTAQQGRRGVKDESVDQSTSGNFPGLGNSSQNLSVHDSGPMGASKSRFSECGSAKTERNSSKLSQQLKKEPIVIPQSFIDSEFPPNDNSISKTTVLLNTPRNQHTREVPSTGFDRLIHWRRPVEYLN